MPLSRPSLLPLIRSISTPKTHQIPSPQRHTMSTTTTTPALRILPLGGSITHGIASTHSSGYRLSLAVHLHTAGLPAHFVGSRHSGAGPHDGWPGARIDQIASRTTRSISRFKPNIVLLNAGSNDCLQDYAMDAFRDRVRELVEGIWARSGRAVVLVSTLVPAAQGAVEERVRRANGELRGLVQEWEGEGRRVGLVEMHEGEGAVRVGDLVGDGTHPNDEGYEKMAELWVKGVKEVVRKGMVMEAEEVAEGARGVVMVE